MGTSPKSSRPPDETPHANILEVTALTTRDDDDKQPMSAPALMQRRSVARPTHKRRPSATTPGAVMPANHFSVPIEMPPEAAKARLETGVSPANLSTLERARSGNNEFHTVTREEVVKKDVKSNPIKKRIGKIQKIASGGHQRKKVKDGQVVFKGHRNWEIVLSFQFGLKYTSELLEDAGESEATKKDYEESLAFDFNPVDERAGFEISKFSKWVHPAPYIYKLIREKFNVGEHEFLEAICSESRVRELPTPGKSGALFYITDDEHYFIKTIQHIEEKMLLTMLPSYHQHIVKNPRTLLTKYLAHFGIQTRRDRHIRMIVMASVFNEQVYIDRKYDLKGSTYKRYASEEQLRSENVTLKDQDFTDPIFFRPEALQVIMEQLDRDTAYLESHSVMDYSLLLGLSEMLPNENASFKEKYGQHEESAPYFVGCQIDPQGKRSGVRVCMGIIDFLQRFRLRKRMEYGARVLQSCSTSAASVAPPSLYRQRFMEFLKSRFLPDQGLDISILVSTAEILLSGSDGEEEEEEQ